MKLFKTIDKILAGFGNVKAMERTHVDTYTENLIKNIKGKKIAESKYGQIFITHQNLNNYNFLNVSVLSATNIKTTRGCDLIFETQDDKIKIQSDTKEVESDFSNVSNRYLTKISFIIDKTEKEMITSRNFKTIHLNYKNKSLPMNKCL